MFRRPSVEQELADELRFHLERQIAENIAAGMSPQEARHAASRTVGGLAQIEEECRDARRVNYIDAFLQDVRYALRMMRKTPTVTVTAILILALGIGANTAIFSVVNTVLLRPLYDLDPQRLVTFSAKSRASSYGSISAPDLMDWRQQSRSFAWMGAYVEEDLIILGGSEPEWTNGARVDPDLFRLLGVETHLGRNFLPEENQAGQGQVIVLSYGLWQRSFGGDPSVLGKTVRVEELRWVEGETSPNANGSFTVVGVMKPHFHFPSGLWKYDVGEDYSAWVPLVLDTKEQTQRERHFLHVIAYVKPDMTLQQAQAEMDIITRRIGQQHDADHREMTSTVIPTHDQYVRELRPALQLLLMAVGFVLLIACANVANLQLARISTRQREMAIRVALGANRLRIIRQLLVESILLSGIGGLVGLFLSYWATGLLLVLASEQVRRLWEIQVDGRVLGFTLAISVLTGALFGLAPALASSKVDLNKALKEAARTLDAGFQRQLLRKSLLIAEVALAFVLLIGAGLLVRSFLHLQNVVLGFRPENLLTLETRLSESKYPSTDQRLAVHRQILKRIETVPGVESAGATTFLPLTSSREWGERIALGDSTGTPSTTTRVQEESLAIILPITASYLQTMGTALRAGRYFTEQDRLEPSGVGIINESLSRRLWLDENPIGKRLGLFLTEEKPTWVEVVGVVADVKHFGSDRKASQVVYIPGPQSATAPIYAVRSRTNLSRLAKVIQREIWSVDQDIPIYVRPMQWWLQGSLARRRFNTSLLGIFGAAALLIAVVGIYGVISYSLSQRTHEIGIRMALGAQRGNVLRLVVRQGFKLVVLGLGVGLLASLALTRFLPSFLFGITATDPVTFAAVSLLLAAVALLACYIPARRATHIDPLAALRHE
jgi:putative ABC transport system permease protein